MVALYLILAVTVGAGADSLAQFVDSFDFECPCAVVSFDAYLDGGSYGGIMELSDGTRLEFAWDGAARGSRVAIESEQGNGWLAGHRIVSNEEKPRYAYIGATHFRGEGARPLPIGSQAETNLLAALQSWVDTVIPVEDQEFMRTTYFDYSIPWRDRRTILADRSGGEFGDVEKMAAQVLYVIQKMEAIRERSPSH